MEHPDGVGSHRAAWSALRPGRARPGSLLAAAMPAGTAPTDQIVGLYQPLFGEGWPEAALWLVAVRQYDNARVGSAAAMVPGRRSAKRWPPRARSRGVRPR